MTKKPSKKVHVDVIHPDQQNQVSPGNLIGQEEVESKIITILQICSIRPFLEIPDYQTLSALNYPLVVETLNGFVCIDGWQWVETAILEGNDALTALVIRPAQQSPHELAIRKVGARIKTEGGKASYAEIIRGVQSLYDYLLKNLETLSDFTHGGKRHGQQASRDSELDVKTYIAKNLNISRDRVVEYLNYSKYLNDAALDYLITATASKKLFEKIQPAKRNMINDLQTRNCSIEAITEVVSAWVIQYLTPSTNDEATDDSESGDVENQTDAAQPTADEIDIAQSSPNPIFNHWTGRVASVEKYPVNHDEIKTFLAELGNNIKACGLDSSSSLTDLIKNMEQCWYHLTDLINIAKNLPDAETIKPREEHS